MNVLDKKGLQRISSGLAKSFKARQDLRDYAIFGSTEIFDLNAMANGGADFDLSNETEFLTAIYNTLKDLNVDEGAVAVAVVTADEYRLPLIFLKIDVAFPWKESFGMPSDLYWSVALGGTMENVPYTVYKMRESIDAFSTSLEGAKYKRNIVFLEHVVGDFTNQGKFSSGLSPTGICYSTTTNQLLAGVGGSTWSYYDRWKGDTEIGVLVNDAIRPRTGALYICGNKIYCVKSGYVTVAGYDIYNTSGTLVELGDLLSEPLGQINNRLSDAESALADKAERSELSPVMMSDVLTPANFPDITHYSREELKLDLLIDMAEQAGAIFNRETGLFGLNGLMDITSEEMLLILHNSDVRTLSGISAQLRFMAGAYQIESTRTLLPVRLYNADAQYLFSGQSKMEVCVLQGSSALAGNAILSRHLNMFSGCISLREVQGLITVVNYDDVFSSSELPCLEDITLHRVSKSLNLACMPKISMASLLRLVNNAANTSDITVTLHPDAFGRLTEDVIAAATEKNISFVTV